jgi:hypothetical protein
LHRPPGRLNTPDFVLFASQTVASTASIHSSLNCTILHRTPHTMPTPSSNQPVEAPSPRSYSFSTCPDDVQSQPHPAWQASNEDQTRADDVGIQSDTIDALTAPGCPTDDTIMYDGRPSNEISSRSTTMSPRPQTATTTVTTPLHEESGPETKGRDAETGNQLSRDLSDSTQRASEPQPTPCESLRKRESPNEVSECIDFDAQEDELWSPSMGPDYSCIRVSQPPKVLLA